MTESKTTPCRAKNKATCRYHRAEAFGEGAADMYLNGVINRTIGVQYREKAQQFKQILVEYGTKLSERLLSDSEENPDRDWNTYSGRSLLNKISGEVENEVISENDIESKFDDFYHSINLQNMTIPVLYQLRRINPVTIPSNNVLDEENESSKFDRSAAQMLISEGEWEKQVGNTYYGGWSDATATAHYRKCGPSYMSPPEENSWGSFNGTFAEEDYIEHGMSADTACNCGALQGRVRVVGSLTDLTRRLVNDF